MGVPLTLSSVPAQTPYVQYVSSAGQTVFPYPFEITQDSDLVVLLNAIAQPTDGGYTVSGQGTNVGGNVTFTVGLTAGTIVTLYRNISIQRITQLSQNGTFFSANFNNEFNKIYLIMQQLQQSLLPGGNQAFALMVPNSNNPQPTTLLTPAAYANKYLSFDANGNPQPTVLTSVGSLTAAIIAGLINGSPQTLAIYPTVTGETGVTAPQYPYGNLLRFGADPTGAVSAVTAFNNALSSSNYVCSSRQVRTRLILLSRLRATRPLQDHRPPKVLDTQFLIIPPSPVRVFSALSNEFGGIYIGNLAIEGGNGSYAIVSARPQSLFEFIHMEGSGGYNGGGIQLQSGSNGATAPGSWETKIRDCLWVAPATTTAYRGYDLSINGGSVSVEHCTATRGSIGFCLNQGAAVRFVNCDAGSQSLTYSSESSSAGQCGFKFTTSAGTFHPACEISNCYTEICTQGYWIDDAQGLSIRDSLANDAATFGGGCGVKLTAGAQNVTVSNCNITLNYSGETGIINTGANTVLENNVITALNSTTGTLAYSTTTEMTVFNSLPLATSAAPSGYVFAGAPTGLSPLISDLTGDPRSFVGTLQGCTTAPTATITYVVSGRTVTLNIPALTAVSNNSACSISGVPNSIIPAAGTYTMQCVGMDNSASVQLSATMAPGSAAITLSKLGGAAFTTSGTKGISASTITYNLS